MKVLLVYSLRDALTAKRPLASLGDIHIGLSYVSASLKARGHSTRLMVLSSEWQSRSLSALEAAVSEFDPRMVALTSVSTQFPFIATAAQRLKQRWPEKFLILGGVHASVCPEEAIRCAVDAICRGEGEWPTVELAEQLESGRAPHGIPNLWLKLPDGSVEKNPTRSFIERLEQLPIPDRAMWHEWTMSGRLTHQVVLPSRGCPYHCSYCSNHALRKLAPGKYVRLRSPADIVQELRQLKAEYPETTDVYLQSETIAANPKWLQELADRIARFNAGLDTKMSFACNFRVARSVVKEEVFAALEQANVRTIEIGLESGSERLRCGVLRRNYSNEDFFRAVALARQHRMAVNVYNMIGLPEETPADYWQTVEVNRRVCPDRSLTSIFFPYPGTDLFERCKTEGLLGQAANLTAERARATLDHPTFSRRDIQHAFNWFEYRVYRGQRPLQYRLRKVLRNKAFSGRWSHLLFVRLLPLWYALRGSR